MMRHQRELHCMMWSSWSCDWGYNNLFCIRMMKKQLLFFFEKHHHTKKKERKKWSRKNIKKVLCTYESDEVKWNKVERRKIGECMREKYNFFLVEAHSPDRTINLEEETSLNRNIKREFSIYTLVIALHCLVDTLIYEDCFLHVLHLFLWWHGKNFVYMSLTFFCGLLWLLQALPSEKNPPIRCAYYDDNLCEGWLLF